MQNFINPASITEGGFDMNNDYYRNVGHNSEFFVQTETKYRLSWEWLKVTKIYCNLKDLL